MDLNAVQNSLYSSSSRISASGSFTPRTRQSSASSTSAVSGRKSLLANLKKGPGSGRFSLSGRSTQSTEIFTRSGNNLIESFGLPLPVLVNEVLTFSDRSTKVSINCSPNGWAWAVSGRRLLVWQYRESKIESPKLDAASSIRTPQRRAVAGQCRELSLPHCDIGHKASLITVFLSEGQQMASCLSVSPTGDVRYWPSIAHDGSSIDETGILEGQEFDELLQINPLGYLLVTTTCHLVLLQFQLIGGRYTIVNRQLKPATGFLNGIGKKFASIIIGLNSNNDKENKFLKICARKITYSDWIIHVLADRWIQQWSLNQSNGNETFLFEDSDIVRKIRELFHQKIWENTDPTQIDVSLLDMQSTDSNVIILVSGSNRTHTPSIIYYLLITLTDENSSTSYTIKNHYKIKYNTIGLREGGQSIKLKFILIGEIAYIYGDRVICQVFLNHTNNIDEIERIELPMPTDKIMAVTIYNNIPLFFSRLYGLVCITPADFEPNDYFNNTITSEIFTSSGVASGTHVDNSYFSHTLQGDNLNVTTNLSMYDLDPDEIQQYNSDEISQLKAAFIFHLKRNTIRSSEILKDLFTTKTTHLIIADKNNDEGDPVDDSKVDTTKKQNIHTIKRNAETFIDGIVISIAKDLAEDIPAADPRWEQIKTNNKHPLGSSISMQIIQQLKEKNLALNVFIEFLHITKIWEKLGTFSDCGSIKSTCHILSDINEKIVATISLKNIHNSHSNLIDEAIQKVLKIRNQEVNGNLTPQDLFYIKTTRIQDIFHILSSITNEYIQSEQSITRIANTILDVNTILLTVYSEVMKFRESKYELFQLPEDKREEFEKLPWTAVSGKNGLRDVLVNLINVTLKHGARATGEPELKQKLYRQLVELINFYLDGRKTYLDSITTIPKYSVLMQQYEAQRTDFINNLVQDDQCDLAAKLAEKYNDFQTLVLICDRTENVQRLNEYIERYREFGFSQFAINWHLRQNKRGDIFERFKNNQDDLKKFLLDHPSMAWIQLIFNNDFEKASRILFTLAQNETEYVSRKRTILSMAKLTSLAAPDTDLSVQLDNINAELALIEFQEKIPTDLLTLFGYDIVNQKVLKAEEIINLCISEENENANELDYRKALELLAYVEDAIDLRHKIWCSAILRDNWTVYNINATQQDLQSMLFFKLVDLCFLMDADLEDFLPPMEDFLDAVELGHLTSEKSFQYLLKLGYEYIYETYKRK